MHHTQTHTNTYTNTHKHTHKHIHKHTQTHTTHTNTQLTSGEGNSNCRPRWVLSVLYVANAQ